MKNKYIYFCLVLLLTEYSFAQVWERVTYPEFKPYTNIFYYCKSDAQGNIWLYNPLSSSPYSAARYDVTTNTWTEYSQSAGTLPKDSTIEALITRRNGKLVAASSTSLYIQNSTSSWNKILIPEIGTNTSPVVTIKVEEVIEDKDENIWVLRNIRFNGINVSHVSRYNGTEWTSWCADIPVFSYKGENALQFRTYGNYSSMKQAPNGDIWLVGRNGFFANPDSANKYVSGGIARWNGTEWKFWMKELGASGQGLNDNGTNFAIDENNRLIIAQGQYSGSPFISGGITMFDNGVFTFYRQDNGTIPSDTSMGLPGTTIYNKNFVALDVATRGSTWYFNSANHGILEFDGTRWSAIANKTNGLTQGNVDGGYGIAIDKNGDVWATVIGGDVVRLRKATTSVQNEISTNGLLLSPNPASTVLRLSSISQGEANLSGRISITNTLGAEVLQLSDSETMDVSFLNQGMYFLRGYRGTTPFTIPFVVAR